MRLRRMHITDYLLLRDLDLRLDRPGRLDTGSYALDFLVGVNGSGKSTVLRALAQSFPICAPIAPLTSATRWSMSSKGAMGHITYLSNSDRTKQDT